MRHRLITATSTIIIALTTGASAADISRDGANEIRDNLNHLLPKDLAKSAPVTVTPAGSRYEIVYDFAKLLAKVKKEDFDIKGLTPFKMFATPQDSGLWDIEGNNNLNVTGHFTGPDKTRSDFTYSVADMVFNSVFDPAISYFRSGDFRAKELKFTSATDTEVVNASFGDMIYKLNSAESATAGRLDFAANGKFSTFAEQISGKEMPPIQISADSVDFDAEVNGVAAKDLKEMVLFVLDHVEQEHLTKESETKFKGMLENAFPLLSSLEETIRLNNFGITSAVGSGGAKSFGYHFKVDGPSNATRIGVAVDAVDVTLDSVLVPAGYTAFLPQALDIQFGVPGMNFAALGDEFMKMDFTESTGDSEKAGQQAAEKLFPGGILRVDFPKVSAKSSVYDVEVSGEMEGLVSTQTDYKVNASIVARDYDKTIAAVQELAKTNPDMTQVSFGLMMIKGFAKADPDGAQRWDVAVASDGSVSVNGQQIKGPDEPATDEAAPSDESAPSDDTKP
ncbi:hypothetical protein [Agrobacterium rosae]|uniref:DUF945 domain-containing protein n=1 Tax=Agrobacterium rosae TaxID=1972867 RepID=A0A1R3U6S7_9HYPH|nr:hypothetical protein [Agrobacterium rosae]POO53806.1 hypothetical protein CTT39_19015 [Agrobacterium rosae]SCX32326.1 hypothetical protein DSM25559_3900 [Agrobacterium rosae]